MYKNYDLYKTKILKAKEWILQNENLDVITKKFLDFYESEKNKKRFGVITTWNTLCGIADYSKYLSDELENYTVFSNRNEIIIADDCENNVIRCFDAKEQIDELCDAIKKQNITHMIINYHIVLFKNEEFCKLIDFLSESKINTIFILHNSSTIKEKMFSHLKKINGVYVHTKKELEHFKNYLNNVFLFNHPLKQYENIDINFDLPKNKKIIATFGFLFEHKGIVEVVEVFKEIYKKDKKTHLLLLNSIHPHDKGNGPKDLLKKINEIIKNNNLEKNVTINNETLSHNEIYSYLNKCDCILYLYKNTTESSSAAVRTGLATGVPIICSRRKIFDDVSEYVTFVDTDNDLVTANQILEILNNEELLKEKKINQINFIQKNTWSNNIKELLKNL
jgi:glycosyltransferase involved in cell wall biosynthesis